MFSLDLGVGLLGQLLILFYLFIFSIFYFFIYLFFLLIYSFLTLTFFLLLQKCSNIGLGLCKKIKKKKKKDTAVGFETYTDDHVASNFYFTTRLHQPGK